MFEACRRITAVFRAGITVIHRDRGMRYIACGGIAFVLSTKVPVVDPREGFILDSDFGIAAILGALVAVIGRERPMDAGSLCEFTVVIAIDFTEVFGAGVGIVARRHLATKTRIIATIASFRAAGSAKVVILTRRPLASDRDRAGGARKMGKTTDSDRGDGHNR